ELERAEVERVLATPGPLVVALGGGALLDRALRLRALEAGRVVALDARDATLEARTRASDRPLLEGASDRVARFAALRAERAHAYAEVHHKIQTDHLSPETIADELLDRWNDRSIVIPLGLRTYSIRHERADTGVVNATRALTPSSLAIISDETVYPLWGER